MIGSESGRSVDWMRVAAAELDAVFIARDEERAAAVEGMQTLEVDVGVANYLRNVWNMGSSGRRCGQRKPAIQFGDQWCGSPKKRLSNYLSISPANGNR
ncbi:MAG: hypothetical protein M1541_16970 [Acidobacteria bacterium]|nr:hypothetical protein [Acidobacteriota bacterium]